MSAVKLVVYVDDKKNLVDRNCNLLDPPEVVFRDNGPLQLVFVPCKQGFSVVDVNIHGSAGCPETFFTRIGKSKRNFIIRYDGGANPGCSWTAEPDPQPQQGPAGDALPVLKNPPGF